MLIPVVKIFSFFQKVVFFSFQNENWFYLHFHSHVYLPPLRLILKKKYSGRNVCLCDITVAGTPPTDLRKIDTNLFLNQFFIFSQKHTWKVRKQECHHQICTKFIPIYLFTNNFFTNLFLKIHEECYFKRGSKRRAQNWHKFSLKILLLDALPSSQSNFFHSGSKSKSWINVQFIVFRLEDKQKLWKRKAELNDQLSDQSQSCRQESSELTQANTKLFHYVKAVIKNIWTWANRKHEQTQNFSIM